MYCNEPTWQVIIMLARYRVYWVISVLPRGVAAPWGFCYIIFFLWCLIRLNILQGWHIPPRFCIPLRSEGAPSAPYSSVLCDVAHCIRLFCNACHIPYSSFCKYAPFAFVSFCNVRYTRVIMFINSRRPVLVLAHCSRKGGHAALVSSGLTAQVCILWFRLKLSVSSWLFPFSSLRSRHKQILGIDQ